MNFIIVVPLAFNLLRTLISYRLCLIKASCGDFSNCGYSVDCRGKVNVLGVRMP